MPFADARRILAARAHSKVRLIALPGGHDTREAITQRAGALIRFLHAALVDTHAAQAFPPAIPSDQLSTP